ncbi:2-hydroxychromene-2-carboxylate isomerase [soil metagenome]
MNGPYDWYFDFISPFAYLQWRRLRRDHADIVLNPKPVLLAAILNHWGQLGPAEVPGKRRHTYRQVLWQARAAGIALQFPPAHPFNPLAALRLSLAAPDRTAAVDAIFRHVWEHGRAADSAAALADVAQALGIADPAAAIADPAVKAELAANGSEAIALGVFGVPTLVIDGELFWGNDATDMACNFLGDRNLFDDPQMRRVDSMPVAAARVPRTPA